MMQTNQKRLDDTHYISLKVEELINICDKACESGNSGRKRHSHSDTYRVDNNTIYLLMVHLQNLLKETNAQARKVIEYAWMKDRELYGCISPRQHICARNVQVHIERGEFAIALHEFIDCMVNFGQRVPGFEYICAAEHVLYSQLVDKFVLELSKIYKKCEVKQGFVAGEPVVSKRFRNAL